MSVNDLAQAVDRPAGVVSQHLAKLRMAGLVRARRRANRVFCRIENSQVRQRMEHGIDQTERIAGRVREH